MKQLNFFRFSVFWIWALTLAIALGTFVKLMVGDHMAFPEIDKSLTKVLALVVPQLSIMLAFLFRTSREQQRNLLREERGIATLAMSLSIFYHLAFWIFLFFGIGTESFGKGLDESADAVVKLMSFLAVFGMSPIAYLFATKDQSAPATNGGG